ncbi:sensor histidine kinase [Paenibacillus sp. MWE-103]|uniref:histidine kinase n=1 Tax=Paenibacillus artemisiicola TaxID=1172618 RepID=A0ABS3WKY7_9BACL|nr:sensor histidine kinase [Paenibacillus artemisiicola]MBO7748942.1 sensor histidine kinase [Paenibacillus artemisiicola]
MIKWLFINRSIRTKIVWSTILTSLIPMLVLSFLFYATSTRSLERTIYRTTNQNAEYLAGYLNQYFRDISTSALQVYGYDNHILELMSHGGSGGDADFFNTRNALKNYYQAVADKNKDAIIRILIYGADDRLRDSWSRAASYDAIPFDASIPHYAEMLDLPFQQSLSFTYADKVLNQNLFVYAITIYDPFKHTKVGSLVFYIQEKELMKAVEANNKAPNVIVLQNSRGEAFYATNDRYADSISAYAPPANTNARTNPKLIAFEKRKDLLVGTSYLDNGNLSLSVVYPNDELARHRTNTLYITVGAFFFAMACIALLSMLAQQYITRPIQRLGAAMKTVRKGNFHVTLNQPIHYRDDISELTRNFNYMTEKIRELIEMRFQLQLRNKEAQLLALQMQINPHFLYNALQTIGGKAVLSGDYDIHEMCRALGDMFRYSFYEGNTESTIGQELAHVGNYLYIQQFRFEDALRTEFDVPAELMDVSVVRFVMQPVIENVVVHALGGPDERRLLVRVRAERDGEDVVLTVRDNGPGIDAARLASLRSGLEQRSLEVFTGVSIGLKNVHERIRLMYGDAYGLEIDSGPGAETGTAIRIRIPYRKRGEAHA